MNQRQRLNEVGSRFLARLFDYQVFGLVTGFVVALVLLVTTRSTQVHRLWVFVAPLAWVPIEALLLSRWHTTPGKLLFGIRLEHPDYPQLSYRHTLRRSFLVWFRGVGGGVPLLTLLTQLIGYRQYMMGNNPSWDVQDGWTLVHGRVGTGRIALILALFSGLVALNFWGNML